MARERSAERHSTTPAAVAPTAGAATGVLESDQLRRLADLASAAILVYQGGRFVYVNEATCRLSGYSEAEMLALDPMTLVPKDFQAAVLDRIARRLRGEDLSASIDFVLVTKSGDQRWLQVQATLSELKGERAIFATVADITEQRKALEVLAAREKHLVLAQRASRSVTWEWNLETDELRNSELMAELFGLGPEDLGATGTAFLAYVHPEDRRILHDGIVACLKGEADLAVEIRCALPGRELWLTERAIAVRDETTGRARKLVGVASDVTERKHFEQALSREKERAQVTLASIGDGVIRTDEQGRIDYLNPVAERLTGWSLEEALGRSSSEVLVVVDEGTRRRLPNPVERCLETGRSIELPSRSMLISRDGREYGIRDTASPVRCENGYLQGAVVVFKDVTELLDMEREVSFLARHDPLTGLLNRREFEARLSALLEAPRSAGEVHVLAYLDLDDFKVVNDTCGHVAGDELIKQVAARLKSYCRGSDTLARLGGDEFAVLREGASPGDLELFGDTLRRAIRGLRFSWDDQRFAIAASIGLVPLVPRGIRTLTEALSAADAACYVAKESGRNRVHVHHPGDNAVAARHGEMQWISRIHEAFAENRFVLYHQRIEPLAPTLVGTRSLAEIFLRMREKDGTLVSPALFVPVAERYHLISAIDRWVVENAFSALSRFRREQREPPYTFAINLSGSSLSDASFQHFVSELFARWDIPGEWICFELTETAAVGNLVLASEFIRQLKGIGCRFVLDDFGSGLSSFAYLKNLPVDFVKIDGEFVRGVRDQPVQRAIVEAIAQIAHVLGLATIGESVEDGATVEILRELGVDHAQGYWLALPAPLEECLGPAVGAGLAPPAV